jgi:hypothetical protein
MLDYARQRAIDVLKIPRKAILATGGPAGIQAGEFPCEAIGLDLYLLLPNTSDHIFNIENDHSATLVSSVWEVSGEAELIELPNPALELDFLKGTEAEWWSLVRVHPRKIHIRSKGGWGYCETIEL